MRGMNHRLKNVYTSALPLGDCFSEWWWCTTDASKQIAEDLVERNFVIIDNFLPLDEGKGLNLEVQNAYDVGLLSKNGVIGGGRSGKLQAVENKHVRGDVLGYYDGTEPEWTSCGTILKTVLDKMSTLVCELRDSIVSSSSGDIYLVPELQNISTRSRAMVTCYPGNDSCYVRHCDNAIGNGRKLTAILYLNGEWAEGDGGELKIYHNAISGDKYTIIAPLLNRLVLFWSDERCMHEVLPTHTLRFAVTVWFIDGRERDARDAEPSASQTELQDDNEATEALFIVETSKKQHDVIRVSGTDDSIIVYQVENISMADMESITLDVGISSMVVSSKNSSFDSVCISIECPVQKEKTVAKYSKKSRSLRITLYSLP